MRFRETGEVFHTRRHFARRRSHRLVRILLFFTIVDSMTVASISGLFATEDGRGKSDRSTCAAGSSGTWTPRRLYGCSRRRSWMAVVPPAVEPLRGIKGLLRHHRASSAPGEMEASAHRKVTARPASTQAPHSRKGAISPLTLNIGLPHVRLTSEMLRVTGPRQQVLACMPLTNASMAPTPIVPTH